MEFTERDVPIYYEIHGTGKPVLMIHGWGIDHRMMKGCMEPIFHSIDAPWQRIYFDLPGMGRTKGQPWIANSDNFLELILAFIDGVIPDKNFVIAGKSYGGYLGRGIIKKREFQVDGLLMVCPLADPKTRVDNLPVFQVLEKDEALLDSLSEEDRQFFTEINVIQNKRVWERFRENIIPGIKIADNVFLKNCGGKYGPFMENVDQVEKPYQQPTLMLMGKQDSIVGYHDHWRLVKNYARSSFVLLDNAGHNLEIEQEVLFNAIVKEWLSRVFEQTS